MWLVSVANPPRPSHSMAAKSRDRLYGSSVRIAAERAVEARREADKLACEAGPKRMLAFKGPAQPALTPCQLSGCIHLGQLASKHRDRGQEIAASVSQVSRNDRVGRVGDIEDTRPLFLVLDVGVEKLNPLTQVPDERLQFHHGAGMVQ